MARLSTECLEDKTLTWQLFDQIAGRYDGMNAVMTMGLNSYWKSKALDYCYEGSEDTASLRVLDLATGTGDLVYMSAKRFRAACPELIGVDLSEQMLAIAKTKQKDTSRPIQFQTGDATALDFEDASVDRATMAFGIRNVPDVAAVCKELFRCLKPGGRAVILESSEPKGLIARLGYSVFTKTWIPFWAKALSPDPSAYQYLLDSTEQFMSPEQLQAQLRDAGFAKVTHYSLSLGAVSIYVADR